MSGGRLCDGLHNPQHQGTDCVTAYTASRAMKKMWDGLHQLYIADTAWTLGFKDLFTTLNANTMFSFYILRTFD